MRENPRQIYQPKGSSGLVTLLLLFILGCTAVLCVVVVKMRQSNKTAGFPREAQATTSTASGPIKPRGQTATFKKKRAGHSLKNAPLLNVTTDSTPVFQSNSANSATVTSLKKGDEVRSGGLEIIDPRGSLTLVQGEGRSGFVPSELLKRKIAVEEPQK